MTNAVSCSSFARILITDSFPFQEEESSLQKLNLSDCKLKTDINNVINALGSNQCLQVILNSQKLKKKKKQCLDM